MKKFITLVFAVAIFSLFGADYRVKGKVEAPSLAGVAVCDGENFHAVGADGSFDFSLNTDCGAFVYLDFPGNLKAEGHWEKALKPGENVINFKLVERESVPETFTFVHGSDVQYDFKKKNQELVNDMAEIARIIKEHDAKFITFPGDLTEFGDAEQLQILRGEFDKNKFNFYALFGGHDRYRSKPSIQFFANYIMAPYYGWHFGGIYFFAPLSEYASMPEKSERIRQVNWINNALNRLAPGTPVMVITHQPWYVFDQIKSFEKKGHIKLLGFLGAHTHYHNLYNYQGTDVLCIAPLRSHDTGTFTKRLRLVTVNPKGIVNTSTRLLNQKERVEATLVNGKNLYARIVDAVEDPVSVTAKFGSEIVEITKLNQFVWQGILPQEIPNGIARKITFTVKTNDKTWAKSVVVRNVKNLKWCTVLPEFLRNYPQATYSDGKLFIGIESGELPAGRGGVIALDAESGKELWRYSGDDVAMRVAADKEVVKALTINAKLLTLDANTGKLLREKQLPVISHFLRTEGQVVMADGKILVLLCNRGGRIYCLDARTDEFVWQKPAEIGHAWSSVNFSVADGKVFFSGAGMIGAINLNDGKDIWRHSIRGIKASAAKPLYDNGAVYFVLRALLHKYDANTGKLLWESKGFPGSMRTIGGGLVDNGKFVTTSTNALIVTDAATGKRISRYNLSPLPSSSGIKYQHLANTAEPVKVNGTIYIFGDDGGVYTFDPATGRPKAIFKTGFAFKGHPTVSGDMIYFVGFDGIVYAMQAQ